MNPGDMIEWVYLGNNELVRQHDKLWSSTMNKWVSIDAPSLVISVTEETYTWINDKGIFHARIDEIPPDLDFGRNKWIIPRAII